MNKCNELAICQSINCGECNMNEFTIKERLTAMLVLQEIKNYAKHEDQEAAITAVLSLAMDMHKNGIDRSFVNQLEYPDVKVQSL